MDSNNMSKMINRTPRAGLRTAVSPDDSGVQLPGVQVDHRERGRGEAFTETSQHSPEDLHICGETHLESLLVSAAELISDPFSNEFIYSSINYQRILQLNSLIWLFYTF